MYSFSEIFLKVRNFIADIPYVRRPFLCPECASFWFGLAVSFLYNPIILDIKIIFLTNIFCGLVTHLFACCFYKNKKSNVDFLKF
jgi:hypothetical protein